MSDFEDEEDCVSELPNNVSNTAHLHDMSRLHQMLLNEKRTNPSQFVSHWEMDEEDVEEATEEEIQNNPVKRLLWAAETGKEDIVRSILEESRELVGSTDSDGYTALHRAAYEGHVNVMEILLSLGAQVDARTHDGWTPLHSASNWGEADCAALLLRHGADINALTGGMQTPLHLAAANAKNIDIFSLLLGNEFLDGRLKNSVGETARDVAQRSCRFYKMFDAIDESLTVL